MRHLTCEPLSQEAFAPFGQVLTTSGPSRPCNDDRAIRFYNLAELLHDAHALTPEVSIYRIKASVLPFRIDYLERHPGSTQLFYPTQASARYLTAVAKTRPDGRPDEQSVRAFIGTGGQGLTYRPGIWHYPLVALDAETDFLMFIFEAKSAYDCEIERIAPLELA